MTVKMKMILSLLTCVKGLELKVRKKNSYFDYENDMAVNLY